MSIKDLHPTEDLASFFDQIERTRNGSNTDGISRHIKKNGEKIYVDISSTLAPIFGKNARHVLIVDITEKLIAEEALRESESFFRQSQEAGKIGSYNLDMKSGLWTSSDVMDDIFGIDKEYLRSVQGWVELVAEEDRAMMDDYFVNHVLAKQQRFNKEYRITRKSDGKTLWVLGLGELTIENDIVTAMVGTIQDISERKYAEIELKEKMYELTRFHNLTVGRELNMIQLKKEINELLVKAGQEPKYKIVE
jgi:PAS domain S-box-containing protein